MKLSKGRGIKFFKQPFFSKPQAYAANIVKASQKTIASALKFINKGKGMEKK